MVGLCQPEHVLLSREVVLPSPACSHHLYCVSASACVSAQPSAPLSWFSPIYGCMIISAKLHWGAPTRGLKGKPAVDWHILFNKPTPWLCVQSKSGASWSHVDTYCVHSEQRTQHLRGRSKAPQVYQTWRTHAVKSISVWPLWLPNTHRLRWITLAT